MIATKYVPLVIKQVVRARIRTVLTVLGVAAAMFLFTAVQAMQQGVEAATQANAGDTTLIVYRKDRFCPFASNMPQSYEQKIRQIDGVKSVVPMRIVVNNCRTSLDVVTFRGVPREAFVAAYVPQFRLIDGSVSEWERRSDAALIGETLANRRGLGAGDRFDAAGITVYVAGVIASDEAQDQNVGYLHLDFLQQASGTTVGGLVTQFGVKVDDPSQLESVAAAIDAEFAAAQEPTWTSPEKAFVARVAKDVIEIVGFMEWLGLGCLLAVLALVANAIVLSVQDRVRDHAILQTLGYRSGLIARLIVSEGVLLSLIGGALGSALAVAFITQGGWAMSVDALSIPIRAEMSTFVWGLAIATALGVAAGLVPAWQASRREIVTCFRAV